MQSRNPFEPPRAPVGVPGTSIDLDAPPMRRPATIDRAFWLILVSAGLGLVSFIARGMHESPLVVAFASMYPVGFAFLIRAGKNWARIVYLVFLILGLLGVLYAGDILTRIGAVRVVVFAFQTVFQGYAAWLAFRSPGRLWFGRPRTMRS